MPHAAWLSAAHHCTSNRQPAQSLLQWWCSKRPWMVSSNLPFFNTLAAAAVSFIPQFVQTNSAERLMLNSHSIYWKRNSSCYLSPGGATLYKKSWIRNQHICSAETDVQLCQKSWKLVQAFWRHKQMWAFKRSGLTFFDHPVYYVNLRKLSSMCTSAILYGTEFSSKTYYSHKRNFRKGVRTSTFWSGLSGGQTLTLGVCQKFCLQNE